MEGLYVELEAPPIAVPPVFELLVLRNHVYVREPGAFVAAVTLNEVACTEGETQ